VYWMNGSEAISPSRTEDEEPWPSSSAAAPPATIIATPSTGRPGRSSTATWRPLPKQVTMGVAHADAIHNHAATIRTP
jgi:hypothetical protein